MTASSPNPALDALGDRLEQAAGTAIATGGPPRRAASRLALVPLLALFAIGGVLIATLVPGGGGQSAEAAVISAAQATNDASTGRFRVAVSTSLDGSDDLTVAVEGAYDLDAGRYSTTMDLGAALAGGAGEDLPGGLDLSVETVIDGDDAYLHLGPAAHLFGAEWLHVTVPELADQQVAPLVDPGSFLDSLEGVADLDEVGREDVRGVETTHYSGALSLARAYESLSPEEQGELEAGLGALFEVTELGDLPLDVWIGDDGLVRRMDLAVDAGAFGVPALGGLGGATVTVELYDIGEPVEIPVPAADQVVSLDDVMDGLFSGIEGTLGDLDLGSLADELEALWRDLDVDGLMDHVEGLFGDDPGAGDSQPRQDEAPRPVEPTPEDPGGDTSTSTSSPSTVVI